MGLPPRFDENEHMGNLEFEVPLLINTDAQLSRTLCRGGRLVLPIYTSVNAFPTLVCKSLYVWHRGKTDTMWQTVECPSITNLF